MRGLELTNSTNLQLMPLVARKLVDEALEGEAGGRTNDAGREIQRAAIRSRWLVGVGGALLIAATLWLGLLSEPRWLGWLVGGAGLLSLWLARPKL